MNFRYNILWLDDEPIKALEIIRQQNQNVNFQQVNYVDVCENILVSEAERYHAVILDANGVKSDSPDKDANKSGFLGLVDLVREKRIPLYIYSGQLLRATDGDTADVILEYLKSKGLQEGKTIFYKSGAPYKMIDQIISDLNSKNHYYVGYEYLLDFFSNGWIANKFKTEFLDNLMEFFHNGDYDSAHGNHMRNITEQILIKVNEEFNLVPSLKKDDSSYYANIAKAIKFKKLDESETISGPLLHMIELSNARSHSALPEDVRKLYFDSDYATFFIVTDWFNRLMSTIEQANTNSTDKENVTDAQDSMKSKEAQLTTKQPQIQKPQTHETRSGIVVQTYKEGDRTYCDLKIEIPKRWKDYSELLITGVKPSMNPQSKAIGWFPFCAEVPNDEKNDEDIHQSTFSLADIAKISKLKK